MWSFVESQTRLGLPLRPWHMEKELGFLSKTRYMLSKASNDLSQSLGGAKVLDLGKSIFSPFMKGLVRDTLAISCVPLVYH